MKRLRVFFTIAVLCFLNNVAFAQKGKATTPKNKVVDIVQKAKSSSQQDFYGEVTGQTYTNKFFGVKLTIPESWLAQKSEVNDAIKDVGSKLVAGNTSQTQTGLNQAIERLTILFTGSKDILGIDNNALITLSVEKPTPLTQIRDGRDYLRLNIQSFKKLQMPADFKYSETINSEKFGNETFYSLDVERADFRQKFYATYRKGYAVFFVLTYKIEKDLEVMKNIIRNADFSQVSSQHKQNKTTGND